MTANRTSPSIWVGQPLHLVCLVILLAATWGAWKYLGEPFPVAFWTAVAFPVVHQVFVWLAWRLELQSSAVSKGMGFRVYLPLFFILFGGRFVSLLVLAWLDRGSLGLPAIPQAVITAILTALGIYTLYSTKFYFGLTRAAGADHFDPRYRDMPLVKQGIFRFTSNGMYIFGFLVFWAIAIGFNSAATVVVAAFSHIYIWVHFYATEKPDMNFLYGSD